MRERYNVVRVRYRAVERDGVIQKPKRLSWHEQSSLTLLVYAGSGSVPLHKEVTIQDLTLKFARQLSEVMKIKLIIFLGVEAGTAVVAVLDEVQRNIR